MFEDIDDAKTSGFTVTVDSPDRLLVYVIWSRNEIGQLPVDEAWAVLAARYPGEPRFLLLHTYEELGAPHAAGAWSPSRFLEKVQRILDTAGGRLHPEVRDLLAAAEDDLHPLTESDVARLDRIRARVGYRTGDAHAAKKRLARVVVDTVRDLHERSLGGRPVGGSGAGAGGGAGDWKAAIAAARGEKKPYAATTKVGAGDLVEHPKFGIGIVTATEPGRAQILFESGARKLLSG